MPKSLIRLFLLPFTFIYNSRFLTRAKKLEKQGKYKDACYAYAVALLNSVLIDKNAVRTKIKDLWALYGPFDYDEEIKKELNKHGDTQENCTAAGHAATMSIIREIINI